MKLFYFFALNAFFFQIFEQSAIKEEILGRPTRSKTNFIENFNLENLSQFVKERKYVMVIFWSFNQKEELAKKIFFSCSIDFENDQVFFLEVNTRDFSQELLTEHHFVKSPEIRLYIYGIPKRFILEEKKQVLKEWISQLISANYTQISSVKDIHPVDTHYIIHVDLDLLKQNPAHFYVLSKLVSPLTIYTGLDEQELKKITNKSNNDFPNESNSGVSSIKDQKLPKMLSFREYDGFILDIKEDWPLYEKIKAITHNEFPQWMDCNDVSLKMTVDHKIPALVYFDNHSNSIHFERILKSSVNYRDYFLLIFVNMKEESKCNQFFREFLAVDQLESLRILDMHGKIKRYEFIGAFTDENIHLFFENFVHGNLKLYRLNEQLEPRAHYKSIKLANHKTFRRTVHRLQDYTIFYVYAHDDKEFEDHILQLQLVKSVFRKNNKFKLFLIDHLRNDLDGYYHTKTPFIVFVMPTGKIYYYERKKIEAAKVIRFVLKHVPFLEITEPDIDEFEGL